MPHTSSSGRTLNFSPLRVPPFGHMSVSAPLPKSTGTAELQASLKPCLLLLLLFYKFLNPLPSMSRRKYSHSTTLMPECTYSTEKQMNRKTPRTGTGTTGGSRVHGTFFVTCSVSSSESSHLVCREPDISALSLDTTPGKAGVWEPGF